MNALGTSELRRLAEDWLAADPDPQTAHELRSLLDAQNEAELLDRFAEKLEFGTAGLRGTLGAGPNRMNRAVVRRTSAGLARYLKEASPGDVSRGIVVGRDARRMSNEFAVEAAGTLAAEGLRVFFFEEPVPTPVVAFATTHLGAAGGVVVTASHNPPQYNGYKIYASNGAQIIPPHDGAIADHIDRVGPANQIPILSPEAARARGLWREVSPDVDRAYLDSILAQRRHPEGPKDVRFAYTPLHGVGGRWVKQAMALAGLKDFHVTAAQEKPDGAFPTVRFPNPEEPGAMNLVRALAEDVQADIVLANDPDADRLAVMSRDGDGHLRALSGDQLGTVLGHYLLSHTPRSTEEPLVITTIVSSSQLKRIARAFKARYEETLTGFKWIANRALSLEKSENVRFLFGYEEALGYTIGPVVRDKDGIGAAVAVADLACWCRSQRLTLWDYLEEIQRQFGVYASMQKNFTFSGPQGSSIITQILEGFRRTPPTSIAGQRVIEMKDYQIGEWRTPDGAKKLQLPSSNVLTFELEDGSRVTLRPSGTEPKIKYYFEVCEMVRDGQPAASARGQAQTRLERLVQAFGQLARERGQPA
jgi:phosphomannomutase